VATILGNDWSNYLIGTAGSDYIYGYGGNDLLEGRGGNDWMSGGSGNDELIGGSGFNDYWGGSGYDTFTMSARAGAAFSDDFINDFTFDVDIIDVSAWGVSDFGQIAVLLDSDGAGNATLNAFYGGLDHILTIDGVAPDELLPSDFLYSASGPKNVTGTSAADVIFGSSYGDILNGGSGDDVLLGGGGNDLLIGGFGIDYFDGGSGYDEVSFAYTNESIKVNLVSGVAVFASGPVEYLTSIEDVTGGGGNDALTGNSLANFLDGGDGNDLLNGGRGKDFLVGGDGSNSFLFNTALGPSNVDTIADFYAPWDTIRLDDAVFWGQPLGTLASSRFAEGNFSSAQDSSDRIIYNNWTGGLFFDRDGIGGFSSVKFAQLDSGLAASLSNFDFLVV
jgi:Ca2+-binding RTX toxin-like protein